MGNGVGTVEVCRLAGVTRSTGDRWRPEMGGMISRSTAATTDRCLSMREGQRIGDLRAQASSIQRIVERIGGSPSTVSRELSRNMAPWNPTYDGIISHLCTPERARRPNPGKV